MRLYPARPRDESEGNDLRVFHPLGLRLEEDALHPAGGAGRGR